MNNLGTNVKFYRNKIGLTQSKLAEMVGISSNYIALIETGKKIPSIQTLHNIADELDVDAKELINQDPLFVELTALANKYGIKEIANKLQHIIN